MSENAGCVIVFIAVLVFVLLMQAMNLGILR